MSYQETVLRTWNENILFSALVELTYRCNLDCVFCYNDLELQGKPMALEDYERFFRDLASLSCLHLTLSGGEPLVHPQFFEIAAKARELGFVLRIKSNGHALRGRMLERLKEEIDPFVVEVSLHGAHAETHDRQTRVPGSFERLVANLEQMLARGLRFKINSTLTRWNESEIEGMFALAERFGAPLTFDPDVTPRDDGDFSPLEIAATAVGPAPPCSRTEDSDDVRAPGGCGASRRRFQEALRRGLLWESPWTPSGTSIPASSGEGRSETSTSDRSAKSGAATGARGGPAAVGRGEAEPRRGGPGMFCPGTAEGLTGSPIPSDSRSTRAPELYEPAA